MKNKLLNPWFITGISDGEGTFTFNRNGKKNYNLCFAIKLIAKDKEILFKIKDYFGVGRIYKVKKCGHTNPAIYYRVIKVSELNNIVSHFDKFQLQSKKKKSYIIWRKMFIFKKENYGKRRQYGTEFLELKKKLSKYNS